MSKVLMNKEGKFLRFSEVSSHSPNKVYNFSFGDLNDATIVSGIVDLKRLSWKGESPESHVVSILKCEVVRIVNIVEDED